KNKVVFIIDEFDKINEDIVLPAILILKSFFNQSPALFILISERQIYNKVTENSDEGRPKEYTIFSHTLFLQRPLFGEIIEYLDNIFLKPSSSESLNNTDYSTFQNYLCYTAKSDFFDLAKSIRNYIKDYDSDSQPILEFRFNERVRRQSNLQKVLS